MIYVETNTVQGAENLAFEEYFLKRKDIHEPIVMLWRNQPAIVVGAFQNTFEEINEAFVKEQAIDILRRTSGGGAVYHDLGNLCFTFIEEREDFSSTDYAVFLQPIVNALKTMGIDAQISGRNDLTIDGAKISGSATRIYKNRVLFHGTLLYSSNLSILGKALRVKQDKLTSKGIRSVRSRVTVITEHMKNPPDVLEFKENLKMAFLKEDSKEYKVSEKELIEIETLADEKYRSYDWTYGKNPPADMVNYQRFACGGITVKVSLEKSKIKEIHFEGDFLGCMELCDIERRLMGIRYDTERVSAALEAIDLTPYFGGITKEELLSCIMG